MSRRSSSWKEGLAQDLRDPNFAQEFILSLIEEGMSLHEALAFTIRAYGIKEFAERIEAAGSYVSRFIHEEYNPTQRVLREFLEPFGLRLSAVPKAA